MIEDVALTTANDNVSDLKMSKREYSMKIKGVVTKKRDHLPKQTIPF